MFLRRHAYILFAGTGLVRVRRTRAGSRIGIYIYRCGRSAGLNVQVVVVLVLGVVVHVVVVVVVVDVVWADRELRHNLYTTTHSLCVVSIKEIVAYGQRQMLHIVGGGRLHTAAHRHARMSSPAASYRVVAAEAAFGPKENWVRVW